MASLLLLLGGRAFAAEDAASHRAKILYEEATKQYDLGDYAQALEAYKAAFLAKPDAAFLFNIGQCHRLMGHPEEAIAAYKTYLRKRPDADNRPVVEELIAEAERTIARRNAPPTGTLAPVEAKPIAPPQGPVLQSSAATLAVTAPPPRARKTSWWIVGAAVGTAVVAGVAIGLGVALGSGGDAPTHAGWPTATFSF